MKLTAHGARALFTGIVTDSGRFRYNNVSSETFVIASKLLKYNFDFNEIYTKLYVDDLELVKLRAQMVLSFKISEKGVAYLVNDKDAVNRYNTDIFTISRGMVNVMSGINGIDIWANFTEEESGKVICEFRSSKYNVNQIAVKYGGGGHKFASGATVSSLAVIKDILKDLESLIEE
jgi:phosphoesterase RecJ-like protein